MLDIQHNATQASATATAAAAAAVAASNSATVAANAIVDALEAQKRGALEELEEQEGRDDRQRKMMFEFEERFLLALRVLVGCVVCAVVCLRVYVCVLLCVWCCV